jgi:formylglycine-generating enzyme required for sulfatase activity
VLDKAAARAEKAFAGGDGKRAATLYDQGYAVAERSRIHAYPAWADFERRYAAAASAALDDAAARLDGGALVALAPALDQAQVNRPELVARRQRLATLPKPGAHLADHDGPTLAFVPARYQGETLDHSFALGVTEVSRADFLAFVDATKRALAKCKDGPALVAFFKRRDARDPGFPQEPQHPAVCVSHDDAVAYAQWLSQRSGQRYRLPTQAEWQHAARGAGEGAPACTLGNVADQAVASGARHDCSDGARFTTPGAKFQASALGLYDLVGNAAEWSADCTGHGSAATCQAMGSSFRDGPKKPLLGVEAHPADTPTPDLGFRVLRELSFETLPSPAR